MHGKLYLTALYDQRTKIGKHQKNCSGIGTSIQPLPDPTLNANTYSI